MTIDNDNQAMIRATKPITPTEQALEVARQALVDSAFSVFDRRSVKPLTYIQLRGALHRIEILLENDNDNKKGN